jgi:hypothetical protein
MEFISDSNSQRFRKGYERNLDQLMFTNYNYKASNEGKLDNQLSCLNCNFILHPGVDITYPKPYNTGKCVSKKERKQISFDIHKQPRLFSDLVASEKDNTVDYQKQFETSNQR